MLSGFSSRVERWPLSRPFGISRGVKTEAVVVVVEARAGEHVGVGECVPYPRYGESPESVTAALKVLERRSPENLSREQLLTLLPAGAARNAVDCALWDLEAKRSGRSVGELSGRPLPQSMTTAFTVSLDTPQAMEEAARKIASAPVIKVKVNAEQPREQIDAVVRVAPAARLIVDPNEGWTFELLRALQPFLASRSIALLEQPIPASEDAVLEGWKPLVPLCADESLHTREQLPQIARRYQVVNIKLDKTGGLTEALALREAARELGLGIMVGCMVCTSLGIAPALHVASDAMFVDLDGPWWLARDREGGLRIEDGFLKELGSLRWGRPS